MKDLIDKRLKETEKEFETIKEAVVKAERKLLMLQGGHAELLRLKAELEASEAHPPEEAS